MSRFVITGATNGAPNRLEINDFVKNEKYFSLFIQALQAMQQDDQDNVPSYFQVGKIHGLPYKSWDGAFGGQGWNPSTTWGGYCAHGSVLFPTWHRPYMMLHEQIIQSHATHIASTYIVDQDAWKEAAQTLRHPFWDWAANAVPPDEVIAMPQVVITGPNGQKVSVHNPLYHYIFHPVDSSFPAPFRNWSTTIRHPTAQGPNATDDVARLKSVLQATQSDVTSSTYNMLTRTHDWAAFSNHMVGDGGSTSNSLEAIHDGIHGNVGGGGQMSDPSVAAFDPLFFLHHCNVDRLLQLWSALNPGEWVIRDESGSGTYTVPPDTPVDKLTALTPFRNGQTSYWDSSALKDTTKLGYNYPDFDGVDLSNTLAVRAAIANRVNQLYGSSIFSGLRPTPPGPLIKPPPISTQPPFGGVPPVGGPVFGGGVPQESSQAPWGDPFMNTTDNLGAGVPAKAQIPAGQARLAALVPPSSTSVPIASVASNVYKPAFATVPPTHDAAPIYREVVPDQGLFDWTARIAFKKYEAGGSFGVLLFLGEVPNAPYDWNISPNYVGSHYAFVNTSASECANCRSQARIVVEGFVHLNQAIVKHSGLNSLEPNVVEPYLTKNLHWRAQSVTGEPVNVGSLEVNVYATPLSYPPGATFPAPGERRLCNAITRGRRA